jgi:hypothetical protein
MSGLVIDLRAEVATAEVLTERLGCLSEAMLVALEQGDHAAMQRLLAEQAQLQGEVEPLLARLLGTASDPAGPAGVAVETTSGMLERVLANLLRAQQSHHVLQERVSSTCADLREQLRAHRRRSASVLAYGTALEPGSGGFSRIG